MDRCEQNLKSILDILNDILKKEEYQEDKELIEETINLVQTLLENKDEMTIKSLERINENINLLDERYWDLYDLVNLYVIVYSNYKDIIHKKNMVNIRKQNRIKKEIRAKINFMLSQIEYDLKQCNSLNDELYLELSKDEIIDFFNRSNSILNKWCEYLSNEDYSSIVLEYKEIESTISELELCLADYEETFKLNVIAYSLYEVGKLLIEIVRNDNLLITNKN